MPPGCWRRSGGAARECAGTGISKPPSLDMNNVRRVGEEGHPGTETLPNLGRCFEEDPAAARQAPRAVSGALVPASGGRRGKRSATNAREVSSTQRNVQCTLPCGEHKRPGTEAHLAKEGKRRNGGIGDPPPPQNRDTLGQDGTLEVES